MRIEKRPNLFLVGAQKAGTSALAGWLREHPEVCMSFPKEPGYLAFGKQGYIFPDGNGQPAPPSRYVIKSYDDYINLYAQASDRQHVLADASTWYLPLTGMAEKLYDFNPEAKIVIVFRNPIDRAYSAWCHARSARVEPCETFAESLQAESTRGEVEFLLRYHQMGLYSEAVKNYLRVFPREQIMLGFYDDLRNEPQRFWVHACDFLGINPAHIPDFKHKYNRSGVPRSRALHRVLSNYQLKKNLRALIPHSLSLLIKKKLDDINLRDFPKMDEATGNALRNFYRKDIAELETLTGRDLKAWLN